MKKKIINSFTIISDATKEEADRLTKMGLNNAKVLKKEIEKIEKEFRKLPAHARLNFYANLLDILWNICGLPPYLKVAVLNNSIAFHTTTEMGNIMANAVRDLPKDNKDYIG